MESKYTSQALKYARVEYKDHGFPASRDLATKEK